MFLSLPFVVLLCACDVIPRDTAGALPRIRGGTVRVGVVHHPPWVVVRDTGVTGHEVDLLQEWAAQLGAGIEWHPGDINTLVEALQRREIDVLAGGLTATTPYAPRLALTQPYASDRAADGQTEDIVLAVTPGESALLYALDVFLASHP